MESVREGAMLRGWPIALMAATSASALLAFGVIQTAFTPQAQALFLVFAAVLFLVMVFNSVFASHARFSAHDEHGERGIVMSGRVVGAITVLAAIAAVGFFWTDNELSGQKIGRYIDRGAMSLSQQAQSTFTRLTDGQEENAS
jgi:hypothetical protein